MAKQRKQKKSRWWKTFLKWLIFVIFSLILFVFAWAIGNWERIYAEAPGADTLLAYKPAQTSVIYDRTGKHKLYELHGQENRKTLLHEEIPDVIRKATLAAEDNNFYQHRGFDLKAIGRAAWRNFRSNEYEQGGSTITQQLARNIFLTQEQTVLRKLKELAISIKIEKELSKDEILDLYLNQIPYGADIYGIEAATQNYFHKSAQELTLSEAAMLAALPKATTYYSPYGSNKAKLVERRNYILERMLFLGLINKKETEAAQANPVEVFALQAPIQAPHFVFYVFDQLKEIYGEDFVRQGGLKVYTSLDYDLQRRAEAIVAEGAKKNKNQYGAENASMVVLNPKNGQILAMVGSRDYFSQEIEGEVNVALSLRQPGSAFKPIIYAKAFEKGFQPETLLYDRPTNFGSDGSGRDYKPKNYDGKSHGLVSMRQALAMSLNIPAVKTLYFAGIKDSIELAEKMGISTLTRKNIYGLSLALGGGEVNLLELTGAFSIFANDGNKAPLKSILSITNQNDREVYTPETLISPVLDSEVARKINSILSDNKARAPVFGPRSNIYIENYQVAAKTGTNQDFRDAWTIGYTPEVVVGVWVGNNDNRSMRFGADGVFAAAPIWRQMILEILNKNGQKEHFIDYQRASTEENKIENNTVQEKNKQDDFDWRQNLSAEEIKLMSAIKNNGGKQEIKQKKRLNIPVEFSEEYRNEPMIKRWRQGIKQKTP